MVLEESTRLSYQMQRATVSNTVAVDGVVGNSLTYKTNAASTEVLRDIPVTEWAYTVLMLALLMVIGGYEILDSRIKTWNFFLAWIFCM